METVQRGYRGVGQEQVINPRLLADRLAANVVPAAQPPAAPVPILAGQTYPELKVLGGLTLTEFNRQMAAITSWVAPPEQGCAYCHNLENMASYEKYTKTVALSMLRMTQDTNSQWKDHVGDTGVTCWTCHRGNAVPKYVWTSEPFKDQPDGMIPTGQNRASSTVAYASLPRDPLTAFLDRADNTISVVSPNALPTGQPERKGIKHAEWTYGLMMHLSSSLGVNCTHCHNSRAFYSWEPTRVKAWYAIRHVRSINRDYIWPLNEVLPASRKGSLGDPKRVACNTCHQGVYKPLFGAPMLKDYPALAGPIATSGGVPAAAPAAVVPPAPVVLPPAAAPLPGASRGGGAGGPLDGSKGPEPKLTEAAPEAGAVL
jgi:photosynthetic reaction center cytochrome c subunit